MIRSFYLSSLIPSMLSKLRPVTPSKFFCWIFVLRRWTQVECQLCLQNTLRLFNLTVLQSSTLISYIFFSFTLSFISVFKFIFNPRHVFFFFPPWIISAQFNQSIQIYIFQSKDLLHTRVLILWHHQLIFTIIQLLL